MKTNAIQRTSQRATTVRDWMVEKANYLNTWYNEKSDFYPVQGNFSCNDLPAREKCLSLPSLTSHDLSCRIEHRSLLSINSRAFFMPPLYRIGGCRSVNQYCSVRRSRDLLAAGCAAAFLYLRPGGSGYANKLRNMQTKTLERSAQRPVDIKAWLTGKAQSLSDWYNGRSEFYSKLCGFEVTRKLATRINLLAVFVMIAVVVAFQQPVVTLTAAACSAWIVYRINADDKEDDNEND